MIKTLTYSVVHLKLMSLQILSIAEQINLSEMSKEIISCGIENEAFESILIWGVVGNRAYAKCEIKFNFDNSSYEVCVAERQSGELSDNWSNSMFDRDPEKSMKYCPAWKDAIDFFVEICKEKGLTIRWSFLRKKGKEDVFERFPIATLRLQQTALNDSEGQIIPNSQVNGLNANFSFSNVLFEKTGGL